jgi:membrane protein
MKKIHNFITTFIYCFKTALTDTINHDGIEHAGYLSFLAILSIFPFLILFVSLAGFLGQTILGHEFVEILIAYLPKEVAVGLKPRLNEIISGPPQSLLTIAVFGAVWTASSSVEGLRTIFNRAYRVSTPPSYIWRRLLSILQFLIITCLILLAMFIIIMTPLIFNKLSSLDIYNKLLKLRFLFTSVIIFFSISFLYYIIPNLKQNMLNICPGALIVMILWSISASIFSLYLNNFDQVNIIYGSLAGFIIALLFFYIIAMILIFGAEFNYAIEKHTGFKFVEKS